MAPRSPRPRHRLAAGGPDQQLSRALARATARLAALDVGFALVGGLAVAVRAAPRFTADVDFVVSCDERGADAVVRDFASHGFSIATVLETRSTHRLAIVRLRETGSALVLDLLFHVTGIEAAIARAATVEPLGPRSSTRVATTGHLIAMKLLADRPQDRADLASLLGGAPASELRRARTAVTAIARAGFAGTRDLLGELRARIDEHAAERARTALRPRKPTRRTSPRRPPSR